MPGLISVCVCVLMHIFLYLMHTSIYKRFAALIFSFVTNESIRWLQNWKLMSRCTANTTWKFCCIFVYIFWDSSVHTNPKPIHYHVHKSPQVTPILSQTNPVYTVMSYCHKIHFILPFHLRRLYVLDTSSAWTIPGVLKRITILLSFIIFILSSNCFFSLYTTSASFY